MDNRETNKVNQLIDTLIIKLREEVGEKINIELCNLDIFSLIIKYFLEYQRDVLPDEYLSAFMDIYCRKVRGKCDGSII